MKLNTKSLSDVEIGVPVLAPGVYHASLNKVEVKANKSGDGNNLVVMIKILDTPVVTNAGKEIENRGQCVCTRYISLKPTPNYDPDQNLKELAVAIKNPPENDLNVEDLQGKLVMVKLSVRDAQKDEATGKEYPVSNNIDRFSPVGESDTFTPPPFG